MDVCWMNYSSIIVSKAIDFNQNSVSLDFHWVNGWKAL